MFNTLAFYSSQICKPSLSLSLPRSLSLSLSLSLPWYLPYAKNQMQEVNISQKNESNQNWATNKVLNSWSKSRNLI